MLIRSFLPNWFLKLIRRRQVSLKKMQNFLKEFESKKINEPTKIETLAIVMPCYNHAEYLPLAFESAVKQTRQPNEIILIDDYSSDNTYEIIKNLVSDYQKNNPNTQINFIIQKNEKNLGQAMTINKANNLTQTDLVMILNDDDYLMDDAVQIVMDTFKNNPGLALVGGAYIKFSGNNFLAKQAKISTDQIGSDKKLTTRQPAEALGYEDFCSLNMTHSSSTFSRLKALSVGLYRPLKTRIVRFSDRDFQIRLNLLYPVGIYRQLPLCFWREDSSQDSGLNS